MNKKDIAIAIAASVAFVLLIVVGIFINEVAHPDAPTPEETSTPETAPTPETTTEETVIETETESESEILILKDDYSFETTGFKMDKLLENCGSDFEEYGIDPTSIPETDWFYFDGEGWDCVLFDNNSTGYYVFVDMDFNATITLLSEMEGYCK